jgi:hypothetical protein
MVIKYAKIFHYIQDPPKFTQSGIFGLKTNDLATLKRRHSSYLEVQGKNTRANSMQGCQIFLSNTGQNGLNYIK